VSPTISSSLTASDKSRSASSYRAVSRYTAPSHANASSANRYWEWDWDILLKFERRLK